VPVVGMQSGCWAALALNVQAIPRRRLVAFSLSGCAIPRDCNFSPSGKEKKKGLPDGSISN